VIWSAFPESSASFDTTRCNDGCPYAILERLQPNRWDGETASGKTALLANPLVRFQNNLAFLSGRIIPHYLKLSWHS
jgi:hypothetical protein